MPNYSITWGRKDPSLRKGECCLRSAKRLPQAREKAFHQCRKGEKKKSCLHRNSTRSLTKSCLLRRLPWGKKEEGGNSRKGRGGRKKSSLVHILQLQREKKNIKTWKKKEDASLMYKRGKESFSEYH